MKVYRKVYRRIFINAESDIDFGNVGVHFTKSKEYIHRGGSFRGCTREDDLLVTIVVDGDYEVNEEATAVSNEEHPREKEVVLAFNQELEAEIRIARRINAEKWDRNSREWLPIYRTFKKYRSRINIGDRCDPWVRNV